ncbi:helix-turn-helix domain-containing protein [Anaerosporobacter sp.]
MKEINIGKKIIEKRKERGLTQEDLAAYVGVSKASVSKWETGQSYPDITTLPVLATYFDISVDELIGYSPQLTREAIHRVYTSLAEQFASKGYEKTLQESEEISKKYYSCFELQLQLAVLYLNYGIGAPTEELKKTMIERVIALCKRVKKESGDSLLIRNANSLEAAANLFLSNIVEVIELLEDTMIPTQEDDIILAKAYLMQGKADKAKETLQFKIYQNVMNVMNELITYLMLFITEKDRFEDIKNRMLHIADDFDLVNLNPNIMGNAYYSIAVAYMQQGQLEEALDMLKHYTSACKKLEYPVKLQGDEFFNMIENKFVLYDIGTISPRDEKTIKESMVAAVKDNPLFLALIEEKEFKNIIKQLEKL